MDRNSLSTRSHLLKREDHTHLVGLERQGIPGLAELLLAVDQPVSGSVVAESELSQRLRERGVQVHEGHSPRSVPNWTRRLIYSRGLPSTHPERLRALRLGVEQITINDAVGEVLETTDAITVIGHRVARVAATMIGWILTQNGMDPTLILGAEIPNRLARGRAGSGPFSVIDLPESLWDRSGASPRTRLAMALDVGVTSPEKREGLFEMARSLPASALFLAMTDDPTVQEMARITPARVERLSLEIDSACDWWGADLRSSRGRFRFRTFQDGEFRLELGLSCPGRRYVAGALAAIAACHALKLDSRVIRECLEDYLGASRAFDHKGTYRGVTLIDDDAIEASDVAETLALARMVYGRRRLWAVYSPRYPVRVPVACFAPADRVMLLGDDFHPDSVDSENARRSDCAISSDWVKCATDSDEALRNLDRLLEPGDVLVTLGTGDMGTIADAFIRRLQRDRQGR